MKRDKTGKIRDCLKLLKRKLGKGMKIQKVIYIETEVFVNLVPLLNKLK